MKHLFIDKFHSFTKCGNLTYALRMFFTLMRESFVYAGQHGVESLASQYLCTKV